jgi:hypothetical protein
MFSPHDPTVAQANYPQPPYSNHNQSPNPGKTAKFVKRKMAKINSIYLSALWTTTKQY